jgi:phosphoenolpyruvate---glycerone phosphotransferase subunit DhaL
MTSAGPISAAKFRQAMLAAGAAIQDQRDMLSILDGTAGDGDLGATLAMGFGQVRETLEQLGGADIGVLLAGTGRTLLRRAPSTIGSLLGLAFMRVGSEFQGVAQLDSADVARLLTGIARAVSDRGGAVPGQRTVVDALDGAAVAAGAAAAAGLSAEDVLARAASGALEAADRTADMEPQFGRAAWVAERARGSRDAGAVAWAIYLGGLAGTLPSGHNAATP